MRSAHITLEINDDQPAEPAMRWERRVQGPEAPFELLGRAFEVALRETDAPFAASLRAFLGAAIIRRADVTDAVEQMD